MNRQPRPTAMKAASGQADSTVVIHVPYHVDEYLPGLDLPLHAGQVVTAELPSGDVWSRLAALYAAVGGVVIGAARGGGFPVVISGDCTTALATVSGLQHAGTDPGIVWIDAHGDLQTLETTTSGYLGGLPLRLLAGYRPELIATGLGLHPVPEQQILLVGARDLDPPERAYLAGARIRRNGLHGLGASTLPAGPLYLHVDLDITDPPRLPGLRYPAPGGPEPVTVSGALRRLLNTGRIAALGIACTWHPGYGTAAVVTPYLQTALAALPAVSRNMNPGPEKPGKECKEVS